MFDFQSSDIFSLRKKNIKLFEQIPTVFVSLITNFELEV